MSRRIELKNFSDPRGSLIAIQAELPFQIKRVFFIFNVPPDTDRGGHRHKTTQLALICINGSCDVFIDNGLATEVVSLVKPTTCLIISPEDFHIMRNFSAQSVLLALANTNYHPDDYIFEDYSK